MTGRETTITKMEGEQLFSYVQKEDQVEWLFELRPDDTDRLNYLAVQENRRCLRDLILDMDSHVQVMQQRWHQRSTSNERSVRKMCEKVLKYMQLHLSTFASEFRFKKIRRLSRNISRRNQSINKPGKGSLRKPKNGWLRLWYVLCSGQSLISNCLSPSQFVHQLQAVLPRKQFMEINRKYMLTYYKEGGKQDAMWDDGRGDLRQDDCYLIYMKDGFRPSSQQLNVESDELLQIDLNLSLEDRIISQSFLWDPRRNSQVEMTVYTDYLLRDLLLENKQTVDRTTFESLHDEVLIQLKSQLRYRTLLKKYKHLLVNFSTLQANTDQKQYNLPVQLRLANQNGDEVYSDNFEWDILNESNNIEQFCQMLIQDEGIPRHYLSELCMQLRTQINNQLSSKFTSLSLIHRSILKERESPKLGTHATSQLRKNIIHSLEVTLPNNPQGYTTQQPVDFNNSQMFSLVSRNIDLVPQQFQSKFGFNDSKKDKDAFKITKQKLQNFSRNGSLKLQTNSYLPSSVHHQFDNSRLKHLYNSALSRQP